MHAYKLTIIPEGSAFTENRPSVEVVRILREIADNIESTGAIPADTTIRDINGNKCGSMRHYGCCRLADDLARDLVGSRADIKTEFGRKTPVGVAEMIRAAIDTDY